MGLSQRLWLRRKSINQSRTNGPMNERSPDYCPGITIPMKNKKHCCKSFVKISAVALKNPLED